MVDQLRAAGAIEAFLRALDLDPDSHPELRGTGARVAQAFSEEFLRGYAVDAPAILRANLVKADPAGAGIVVVRGIAVVTMCPHHLLPAEGTATVAFATQEFAVGLGAVVALVNALAARLVLQETLGEEIVEAIWQGIAPRWIACRLHLRHGCMTARGERAHGASVETIAERGLQADRDHAAAMRLLTTAP